MLQIKVSPRKIPGVHGLCDGNNPNCMGSLSVLWSPGVKETQSKNWGCALVGYLVGH